MKNGKYCILIADDEKEIRDILRLLLEGEGYAVLTAEDGREAIAEAAAEVDLYILDVNMPEVSGFPAAAEIRKHFDAPIVFLTAYSTESDKVMGFSVGADDYIVKPFSNMELISRVKALLRRRNVYDREIIDDNAGNEYIDRKDIRIYENKNRVEVNGIGVKFTRKEYEIIKLLAKHPDRIYTLEVIYSNIWEELYTYNSGNTVMVHIKNIRNKFYEICNRAVIETIWGKGYKFEK